MSTFEALFGWLTLLIWDIKIPNLLLEEARVFDIN